MHGVNLKGRNLHACMHRALAFANAERAENLKSRISRMNRRRKMKQKRSSCRALLRVSAFVALSFIRISYTFTQRASEYDHVDHNVVCAILQREN